MMQYALAFGQISRFQMWFCLQHSFCRICFVYNDLLLQHADKKGCHLEFHELYPRNPLSQLGCLEARHVHTCQHGSTLHFATTATQEILFFQMLLVVHSLSMTRCACKHKTRRRYEKYGLVRFDLIKSVSINMARFFASVVQEFLLNIKDST